MISVDAALALIAATPPLTKTERLSLDRGTGRVLAADVLAAIDQPPFRASAMDGFAVHFDDAIEGARLRIIGEAAAGRPFRGDVGKGEAVRIFTGGVVPEGADHIVIQEDAHFDAGALTVAIPQGRRSHVRDAGIDFRRGATLKRRGERLSPMDLALIAAGNVAFIDAVTRPVIAYFDNGDELVEPGGALAAGQIVGSNRFAFEPTIAEWGGVTRYLGRAPDEVSVLRRKFAAANEVNVLIAIGGASVGDHDLVRAAFADGGGDIIFAKIAVKPGKPTWFGSIGSTRVLGLPGNPASALVCAMLFLRPLIAALTGQILPPQIFHAAATERLPATDGRETYLRGVVHARRDGRLGVTAFSNQDSSLLSPLAAGNCLIRRLSNSPAAEVGSIVDCLLHGRIDQIA